jgi:hypothetical protein
VQIAICGVHGPALRIIDVLVGIDDPIVHELLVEA